MTGYIINHKESKIEIYDSVKEAKKICQLMLRFSASLTIFYYSSKKPIIDYFSKYEIIDNRKN